MLLGAGGFNVLVADNMHSRCVSALHGTAQVSKGGRDEKIFLAVPSQEEGTCNTRTGHSCVIAMLLLPAHCMCLAGHPDDPSWAVRQFHLLGCCGGGS